MDIETLNKKIDLQLSTMPDYIADFVQHKIRAESSPRTIIEYLKNYNTFFTWALYEGIIADTSIDSLASLSTYKMNLYKSHLMSRKKEIEHKSKYSIEQQTLSKTTIKRHITALKVLFKYLATSSDNPNEKPYLDKDPMYSVENVKDKATLQSRADAMEDHLFDADEFHLYLQHIANEYEETLSPQARKFFKRDKERDLAINALLLGSGMRLSELVNINVANLSLEKNRVIILRKGNKTDSVKIAAFAMEYLANYLNIRKQRYNAPDDEEALFLSTYKGEAKRITGKSVEKLVAKYSSSFKHEMSPHDFRHSLASALYKNTNSIITASQQLGHSANSNVTNLYLHVGNDESTDAINSI